MDHETRGIEVIKKHPGTLLGGVLLTFWQALDIASRLDFLYTKLQLGLVQVPYLDLDILFPLLGLAMIVYALLAPKSAASRARELKREAREIKRRWPESEFLKEPINRPRWSPFVGADVTVEQNECVRWHDKYRELQRQIEQHADFDDVMAALDKIEHESFLARLPFVGKYLR